jgi:hypothetical protein
MIEGQVEAEKLGRREPPRIGRVVATPHRTSDRLGEVQNGDRVAPGVAIRIGVDPDEFADPHPDARLFPRLARACALGRLAPLTEPSR